MKEGKTTQLNILLIINTLRQYSGEESPMSVAEICAKINLNSDETKISKSTVTRILNTYMAWQDRYVDFSEDIGFSILLKDTPNKHSNTQNQYYYKSSFTEDELITLYNCIETHPFFNSDEIIDLGKKLKQIHPALFDQKILNQINSLADRRLHSSDSLLKMNISDLLLSIKGKKQIEITYGKYDIKKNLINKTAKSYIIEPIAITWSNGFCYLLAKNKHNFETEAITSYRVDRIMDINPTDIPCTHIPHNFSCLEYQKAHPVMHTGINREIKMLCKDNNDYPLGNLLMDTFLEHYSAHAASQSDQDKYLDKSEHSTDWFMVSVNASVNGTILWAKQHMNSVIIVYPPEVLNQLKADITCSLARYDQIS